MACFGLFLSPLHVEGTKCFIRKLKRFWPEAVNRQLDMFFSVNLHIDIEFWGIINHARLLLK